VFGSIKDIAFDPQNRVYVLDSQAGRMAIFDSRGRHVASTGRKGRGPGELLAPAALTITPRGDILVLDPPNMRVTSYRLGSGTIQSTGSFRIPFPGADLCMIGERIFVQGAHRGNLIHEFTLTGTLVRSFGVAGNPIHPAEGSTLSSGYLVCTPSVVIYKPRNTSVVRAFHTDGRPRWQIALNRFAELQTRPNSDGSLTFSARDAHGVDYASQIFGLGDQFLMIQLRNSSREVDEHGDEVNPRTMMLELGTGRVAAESQHLPSIADIRGGAAYAVVNSPFPQIRRHPVTLIGRNDD
nr:6-bladed beta-propeller [Gemmatimonadota bacterium]